MITIAKLVIHELKRSMKLGPLQFLTEILWLSVMTYPKLRRELGVFLKLRKGENSLVKEIEGSKMYLDIKRDKGLSTDLTFVEIREPFSTKTFRNEIEEGDVVVDIGANIGYYALMEAKMVKPAGKVYAIEPLPCAMEILKYNIELNKYSNIEVFQLAIGEENGRTSMCVCPAWNSSSVILPYNTNLQAVADKIDVDIITLDDFLKDKRFPNLIRMDVEGFEYHIIRGMKSILESGKPLKLFIELHSTPTVEGLLLTLKSFGFQVKKVINDERDLLLRHGVVRKVIEFLNRKRLDRNLRFGYLNMTLDDMLESKFIVEGKFEALHVFFERKNAD